MSLLEASELAQDGNFVARVTVAALQQAITVSQSSATSGDERNHGFRVALATTILNAPQVAGQRIAWVVAANPGVTAEASDGDIQYTVNTYWDALASVPAAPSA